MQKELDFSKALGEDIHPSESEWIFSQNKISRKKENKISEEIIYIKNDFLELEKNENKVSLSKLKIYKKAWFLIQNYFANPLSSISNSKTMLLPHQVQAALRVLEHPRPRFLIADEVGLGKTIEAGLIIKELLLKYKYEKILICVPAPLLFQWQAELKTKFNEDFKIVWGSTLKKDPNFIKKNSKILVSIDLAKEDRYKFLFSNEKYDIIVFDEAHRLRREQNKVTQAYHFAEEICHFSLKPNGALLLLSATPFRGKLEELYYLIRLIDPDILGPLPIFLNNYLENRSNELRKKISPVVIRRRKVDVGGFTKRFAKTVKVSLSLQERVFYDETTEYVKKEFNRAIATGSRMKIFVMILFQKLLDSSTYALLKALERRKERLEKTYFQFSSFGKAEILHLETEYSEFLEEDELEEETPATEAIFDPKEVRQEILTLVKLIKLGKQIETDNKLLVLIKTLKEMQKLGHKKFVIFTQFKSTLEFIDKELKKDFKVSLFHGGLSGKEKEDSIEELYADKNILICTEAGGEGRNLQIATALINYDLPWSPLKIEQRIGRIHRFGQKKDVHILNFTTKDTVAERVLEVLEKKIQLFEDALGESDTLLGILEDEVDFSKNFLFFLNEQKTKKEFEEEFRKGFELAKEYIQKVDKLISPEFLSFDMNAFTKIINSKDYNTIHEKKLREVIEFIAKENKIFFKTLDKDFVILGDSIEKATFKYEAAEKTSNTEYLAIGHTFIDKLISKLFKEVESNLIYTIENSKKKGYLIDFKVDFLLDKKYKRYYSLLWDENKKQFQILEKPIKWEEKEKLKPLAAISFFSIKPILEKGISYLKKYMQTDIQKIRDRIQKNLGYLSQNIESSHQNISSELDEKLQIQKGKSKWYGGDKMVSAIQRTVNKQKEENFRFRRKLRQLEETKKLKIFIEIKNIVLFSSMV